MELDYINDKINLKLDEVNRKIKQLDENYTSIVLLSNNNYTSSERILLKNKLLLLQDSIINDKRIIVKALDFLSDSSKCLENQFIVKNGETLVPKTRIKKRIGDITKLNDSLKKFDNTLEKVISTL